MISSYTFAAFIIFSHSWSSWRFFSILSSSSRNFSCDLASVEASNLSFIWKRISRWLANCTRFTSIIKHLYIKEHILLFFLQRKTIYKICDKNFYPKDLIKEKSFYQVVDERAIHFTSKGWTFITLYMCLFLLSNNLSETLYCWKKFQPYYRRSKLT